MRLAELITEDKISYNLEQRYDDFNTKFFDGKLPKIKISFSTLKTVGGSVTVKKGGLIKTGPAPNPILIRRGLASKYDNYRVDPDFMVMKISDLFKRDNKDLDAILLHEMIHVYFFTFGPIGENHGQKFRQKLKEIQTLSGITIPLTDDVKNLELSNDELTKRVVLLIIEQPNGNFGYAMMNEKSGRAALPTIKEVWEYNIKNLRYKSVKVYLVASPYWTTKAMKMQLQTKVKALKYYRLSDQDKAELTGELLLSLK